MFLYTPKTDEQREDLILMYQLIIDHPKNGLVDLLFSKYHYRYHFIEYHENNRIWKWILEWTYEMEYHTRKDRMIIFTTVFCVFSYYGLHWCLYAFKLFVNYKKIRYEAPLNLLKLG